MADQTLGSTGEPLERTGTWACEVEFTTVGSRLVNHPLFKGCDPKFLDAIAEQARRADLKADEEMDLKDGGPLIIVENGALRICIGAGPAVIVGPGTVLNCAGFLGALGDAEAYKPRRGGEDERSSSKESRGKPNYNEVPPYNLTTNPMAPPPTLFVERKKMSVVVDKRVRKLTDDECCFYNLCPQAAVVGASSRRPGGWMTMKVTGALAGAQPLQGDARHTEKTEEFGGARFAVIPNNLIEHVAQSFKPDPENPFDLKQSLARCNKNAQALKQSWRLVLGRCSTLFANVPPHVMWAISEMVDSEVIPEGECIVSEGEVGEGAESVKIIEEGSAIVEKTKGINPNKSECLPIGRLGPGAVIGDLCLIGATIPRPATARASTAVHVLTIHMRPLLALIRFFPGMLAAMGARLRAIAGYLQTSLPLCSESMGSMTMFAACDVGFLRAISGDRRAFFGGHVFVDEEDVNGVVYAVEYGRCGVEVPGQGMLSEVPIGKCFGVGGPIMVGKSEITAKGAVVRVVTPISIVLQIEKKGLLAVFERFGAEKQRFDRIHSVENDGSTNIKGGLSEKINDFRDCGHRFIDNIFGALEMKCYMTGQTIVVMGAQDASQMFILKSGTVELEKDQLVLGRMTTGATFGELVMLGVTRRRTITIRAATMCFTMEIPRATFLSAIEKNPEERPRFEQLAIRRMDLDSAVIWPVLRGAPERMLLLLNLHAERRMCTIKDPFLNTPATREAALLLLQGTASIFLDGAEVQPLNMGECFNEQILLGVPNSRKEYVVPKTQCEVQIVTKAAWDKVCDEFYTEQDSVKKSILKHMAERAEFRLGVVPGSTTMLKSSALFRGTSEPFVQAVRDRLKNNLYRPGRIIIEAGKDGDGFYLLLDGIAQATLRDQTFDLSSGANFGEAVLIGIVKAFQKTVRATTLCIVQKLRKADFKECLQQHPGDQRYFELPVLEAEKELHESLPNRCRNATTFENCEPEFLEVICPRVDDQFFMPQEKIIKAGDKFILGESYVFLLLAGQAVAEDNLGVTLGIVNVGEIMGEAPLVGMASGVRTANVRAWSRGLVHCAKIPSAVLHEMLEKFPQEKEILINLCKRRHARNLELIARRTMWLNEVAVPSLSRSRLFAWCDIAMMQAIAAHLAETVYSPGEEIVRAGDVANSMIVLLEGVADLESKCGMNVGSFTDGAVIGEVAVLGIFSTRTATVVAFRTCRVIQLAAEVFSRTLPGVENASGILKAKLEELADGRHEQVKHGLPLSALPLGIPPDDVCVRAVALQADRIDLEPGEILEALSDRSPCGPHFSVLVRGRAELVHINSQMEVVADARVVMALSPGSMIIEGTVADYSACLRAKTACELYRVRQSDFMIAVLSVPAAHEWFYRFRLLERETKDRYLMRLKSAQGALEARRPTSASSPMQSTQLLFDASDGAIEEWRPGTAPQGARRDHDRTQRGGGTMNTSLKAMDISSGLEMSLNKTQKMSNSRPQSRSNSRPHSRPHSSSGKKSLGGSGGQTLLEISRRPSGELSESIPTRWERTAGRADSDEACPKRPLKRVGSAPTRARRAGAAPFGCKSSFKDASFSNSDASRARSLPTVVPSG